MRPNVRTNDVTRLCLLTKVNDEYYSQITSGHHFRVCVYMNSNVITLWSNQCMPHSHAILYWNNNKTRPSLVHSRETINTGPTNVNKSNCMLFQPNGNQNTLGNTLNIGIDPINHTLNCKFLGIFIDNQFRWNNHLESHLFKIV